MTVKFQVVGIFYSDEVAFNELPSNPNVGDVMEVLKKKTLDGSKVANFNFTKEEGTQFVIRLMIDHKVIFYGRTGHQYHPGVYQLSQDLNPSTNNAYTVWQYYVFDGDKQVPVSGETPITQTPVKDNYKIIWRLVEICAGPSQVSPRLYKVAPTAMVKTPDKAVL